MVAVASDIAVPAGSRDHRIPRQRVFYLGYHEYSAGPGLCWHTKYWVKRLRKGEAWELFGTMPDVSGRQRISMGEHTPDEVRGRLLAAVDLLERGWS